jgi:putative phage-type endonuclease
MTRAERKAWLKRRDRGVGGSDADIIMGTSPFSTPFELWARKTGRLRPQPRTNAMDRGLELEPRARRAYEMKTGIKMPPKEIDRGKYSFMRANLDGINLEHGRVLEMKCPGQVDHATAVAGQVPEKYQWQCVHNLAVPELEVLDYWSFDGWDGVVVTVLRDLAKEEELIDAEARFWWHVVNDVPPPVEVPKLHLKFESKGVKNE